jgi:hypothetical protein
MRVIFTERFGGLQQMSKLYPYPAVQYIPLAFRVLFRRENYPSPPLLLIGPEISTQNYLVTAKNGVTLPTFIEDADQLFLFTGGLEPLEVKYRGYYVTIKAMRSPVLTWFSVPKRYFYKTNLVFQAKTDDGDLLVSKSYQRQK